MASVEWKRPEIGIRICVTVTPRVTPATSKRTELNPLSSDYVHVYRDGAGCKNGCCLNH